MTQSEQLNSFRTDYEDYILHALKPTQQSIKEIFKAWKTPEYWKSYSASAKQAAPTPVQRCIIRIKRPESVTDKIFRKSESFPDGLSITSVQSMHDTLGRV